MADTILGTLTIGQAPRPDVTPILDRYVPTSIKRIHRGLLDGLSRDEIAGAYAAKTGEAVVVTRLSDGSSVQLSAQKVHSALQGRLDALETDGCNIVLLLCTGAFGGLHLKRGFLLERPDHPAGRRRCRARSPARHHRSGRLADHVRERQMESARAPTALCGGEPLYGHTGRRHRKWRFACA